MRFRTRAQLASGKPLAFDPKAFGFFFMSGSDRETEYRGSVAIVKIDGPLEHKPSWCWDSYEEIRGRFEEAICKEDVDCVVLKIDSPGGDVDGLMETVKAMRALKAETGKPVYAYANELAASAAYAISCAADEIWLPPSGGVGSIGVISMLGEQTRADKKAGLTFEVICSGERKPDGNPHIEISDGARKRVTDRVMSLANTFFGLVAEARGIDAASVKDLQADVFYGNEAVSKGLADGVMSFDELIEHAQGDSAGTVATTKRGQSALVQEEDGSMSIIALRRDKKAAQAKLAAAKTPAQKRAAKAELDAATKALLRAEGKVEGKTVKKYKKTEEQRTEESDDAEDSAAEDAEDAEDAEESEDADDDSDSDEDSDGDDDSDSGDDDDAEDAEDEDDDSDDDASDAKKASAIVAAAREITGHKSVSRIVGALRGMAMSNSQFKSQFAAMQREVADLKRKDARSRVKSLVEGAIKAGQLTPAQRDSFVRIGMRDVKELKAILAEMPKRVAMHDSGTAYRESTNAATSDLSEKEIEISERAGSADLYKKAKAEGKLVSLESFLGIEN